VIYILDASAIIAYLRGEPGADVVSAVLVDPTHECLVHALNLCEVYYDFYRANGERAARDAMRDIFSLGVQLRSDLSIDFWQAAGTLKATARRISLADCFAVTLAQALGGTVLTSDHHEFDALAARAVCAFAFIR
jgi:PIN domain nuclease of toxin-antitoxin system